MVPHDRLKQVIDLVDKRVLPPNDVPLRPPVLPERVVALRHQYVSESLNILVVKARDMHLQMIHILKVE